MNTVSRHQLELPRIPAWHTDAACRGTTAEDSYATFFPASETDELAAQVYADWCRHCSVIQECLASALRHGGDGIYAGTTIHLRKKLMRKRSRARCPQCSASTEITVRSADAGGAVVLFEVCRFCGASWPADKEPETLTHAGRTRLVVDVPLTPEGV